jgi:DNA-binding MarR family transcriptional regulator
LDRVSLAIAQWQRERPDLDTLPMAVLARIAVLARAVARDHLDPVFARFGLQAGDFDVLATLRRAGAPHALSPTELYTATMVTSGTMTSRLDRLEGLGLIARAPDPRDRRALRAGLTEKGRALIDEAVTAHVENEAMVTSALSRAEQEELDALLAKLLAGLPER